MGQNARVEVPATHYARTADGLNLAYQVFGEGPPTVLVPALLSNVEVTWDHELYRRIQELSGRFLRVLQFDKRGIGCSDRFDALPTLEQRIDDISAVMDAVGFERAHFIGLSEGGLMTQLFAIRHPERVDRVALLNSAVGVGPRGLMTHEEVSSVLGFFEELTATWGERPEVMVERMMPSRLGNESFLRWVGRLQRLSSNPADMRRQVDSVLALEAPRDLGRLRAPTLVMQTEGDRVIPRAFAEYLLENIPDARPAWMPGTDHFLWVDDNWRDVVGTIVEFLTGRSIDARATRTFATVLFTDLVGSTSRASSEGDMAWHDRLDGHDRICRRIVEGLDGRLVKNTGDGILATFATPSTAVAAASALARHLAAIGLPIRGGVHAGEIELHADGDVSGLAVNLAARVEQAAADGEVWISSTVRDLLLGSSVPLADRGEHELKGIDGSWRLFAIGSDRSDG